MTKQKKSLLESLESGPHGPSLNFEMRIKQLPIDQQEEMQKIRTSYQAGKIVASMATIRAECAREFNLKIGRDAFERWLKTKGE